MTVLSVMPVDPLHHVSSAALASLRTSFRLVGTGETAQVAAVEGAGGWPARARTAVIAGAASVLVHAPAVEPPDDIMQLARTAVEHGAEIAFAEPYAGDPALEEAHGQLADRFRSPIALLVQDVRSDSSALPFIFDTRRVLRRLGHHDAVVDSLRVTAHGVTAIGRTSSGGTLVLESTASDAESPRMTVQAHAAGSFTSVELFGEDYVRPAIVRVADADGLRILPAIYETASRAAWRRAHAVASRTTSGAAAEITGLAEDAVRAHEVARGAEA